MAGIKGTTLRIAAIFLALALLPVALMGILSIKQMSQASADVEARISDLSTTLNRSALTVEADEADQLQLAIAKAGQYDAFFRQVQSENEMLAGYTASNQEEGSCTSSAGIWIAPYTSNATSSERRTATIALLCVPSTIMKSILSSNPHISFSFIGTEDGVLATWPITNETLNQTAPFNYKDNPYYVQARDLKRTIWTAPFLKNMNALTTTCITPIFRNKDFFGVAGLDLSLKPLEDDLNSLKVRGYPFILDSTGKIIISRQEKPSGSLKDLFKSEDIMQVNSSEARAAVSSMTQGKTGSSIIALENSDIYLAYAPISTPGWSLGLAYQAEEMSLPARFIDAGTREVAAGATQGLKESARMTEEIFLLIFVVTAICTISLGIWQIRRFNSQMEAMEQALAGISRGDFSVLLSFSGFMAPVGTAISQMAEGLKGYSSRLESEARERGAREKEATALQEMKRLLAPAYIPQVEGYEIALHSSPAQRPSSNLCDIFEVEDAVALTMASVGGAGINAALQAAIFKTLLRSSKELSHPSQAMGGVNAQVNKLAAGMHVACFYALLDPLRHELEHVNAGYSPPFIVDSGGMVDTLGGGGMPLGAIDRLELRSERIPMQPGDVLVIYSSGVTEIVGRGSEQFGTERLITAVRENRARTAREVVEAIQRAMAEFSAAATGQAELMLIVVKRE
jgi:sigma-B regulation protein RsbU (phosphoserine phosphatase)